jgi:sporulation protein YlmC with PRC-barrel domain
MSKKILMGASVLAMLVALPALAAEHKTEASTSAKVEAKMDSAGEAIKDKANKAEASIERNADKAEEKAKEAYADVKAYFNDDHKDGEVISLNANSRLTAEELIGAKVEDASGKNLGEIKDILISKDGDAETVIISDSAFGLGGKLAAFDYDVIKGFTGDKDAVAKLTEAQIKNAKRFEYKADAKADANTMVQPADQLSVAKILDSKVYDANGKAVADVDTVAFEGDDADYIVVTFNKILGIGGDKAALNIDALGVAEKDDKYRFTLTQQQSAQFQTAKENAKAN